MIDCVTAATKRKWQWCSAGRPGGFRSAKNHRPPALAPCLCRSPVLRVDWLAERFFDEAPPPILLHRSPTRVTRRRCCWRVAYGSMFQQELQVEASSAPEQGFEVMEHWRLLKSKQY